MSRCLRMVSLVLSFFPPNRALSVRLPNRMSNQRPKRTLTTETATTGFCLRSFFFSYYFFAAKSSSIPDTRWLIRYSCLVSFALSLAFSSFRAATSSDEDPPLASCCSLSMLSFISRKVVRNSASRFRIASWVALKLAPFSSAAIRVSRSYSIYKLKKSRERRDGGKKKTKG